MRKRGLPVIVALWALCFGACSTIESRLKERRAAFDAMPASYQQLILTGQIVEGMPKDGVYIAWGRPDAVSIGSRSARRFETWHYYIYQTVEIPDYTPVARGYVGRHGRQYYYIDPVYSPSYYTRRYSSKWCTFEHDRVVAWESYLGF